MIGKLPWQFLGKSLLVTGSAMFLHLGILDAIFILLSTDVIQILITPRMDR